MYGPVDYTVPYPQPKNRGFTLKERKKIQELGELLGLEPASLMIWKACLINDADASLKSLGKA